jgi:hypothetical protein
MRVIIRVVYRLWTLIYIAINNLLDFAFLAIMRLKTFGRDNLEGAADVEREPEALEAKSTGVFWREPIIIDNINNNKL